MILIASSRARTCTYTTFFFSFAFQSPSGFVLLLLLLLVGNVCCCYIIGTFIFLVVVQQLKINCLWLLSSFLPFDFFFANLNCNFSHRHYTHNQCLLGLVISYNKYSLCFYCNMVFSQFLIIKCVMNFSQAFKSFVWK